MLPVYSRSAAIETVYTYEEWLKEYNCRKTKQKIKQKKELIYYIKQRLLGGIMAAVGIIAKGYDILEGVHVMDFRAYAEQRRKEAHKEIIFDICMEINNCANCHNDETRQIECCPLNCVELHKVSANSFYMIPYENSETNRNLI